MVLPSNTVADVSEHGLICAPVFSAQAVTDSHLASRDTNDITVIRRQDTMRAEDDNRISGNPSMHPEKQRTRAICTMWRRVVKQPVLRDKTMLTSPNDPLPTVRMISYRFVFSRL